MKNLGKKAGHGAQEKTTSMKKAGHGAPGKAASMKKAGRGASGKAASMKKAGHGATKKATAPVNKATQEKKADVPGEWLYFAPQAVGVRQIADALEEACEMEIWQEAGVLEIMYSGESSMDMEEGTIHPKDQVTAAFAEEHGCDRVYLVTFSAEEYEKALPVLRRILQECGGIFCGDTEDFMPLLTE